MGCLPVLSTNRGVTRCGNVVKISERMCFLCPDKTSSPFLGNMPVLVVTILSFWDFRVNPIFLRKSLRFHGAGPLLRPICSCPFCTITIIVSMQRSYHRTCGDSDYHPTNEHFTQGFPDNKKGAFLRRLFGKTYWFNYYS